MKKLCFVLIGTTALVPLAAMAQTATPAQPAGAADCDRLVVVLQQHEVANAPITLEQAQLYQRDRNEQACRDAMARPEMASAATPMQATQQNGPTIRVDQAAPQVKVQQAQPTVTVNQPQPEITVHQPAPTVTVDIPQPEITIRMPKPQVNVAMAQPNVQVSQPKPSVQIVQPARSQAGVHNTQADVSVQQPAQANVKVQDSQAQSPKITYTRDQPKVVVNQDQGEPNVKVEQADQTGDGTAAYGAPAAAMTPPNSSASVPAPAMSAAAVPGTTAPAASTMAQKAVTASSIMKMNVLNAKGNTLGDVEHVLMKKGTDQSYVVIGHGGFLGLGQKMVALPVDQMFLRNGNLVMRGLTDDQIRSMPNWSGDGNEYTDYSANQTLRVDTSG